MEYNVFNTTRFVVVMVTTVCNLKCKHCCSFTPYQPNPTHFPIADLKHDISRYFEIFYDAHYPHFDFIGGEPLLHPDLPKLVSWIFSSHSNKFDELRILTNGVTKISDELVDACKGNMVSFLVDDYGKDLSVNADYNCKKLDYNNISYRHRNYYDDNQHMGGWIDFGDLSCKNYSKDQIYELFNSCKELISPGNIADNKVAVDLHIMNGKVFACDMQLANAGHIPLPKDEYIDLRTEEAVESIRKRYSDFKKKPLECCKYCVGFSADVPRVPAGIQLNGQEMKNRRLML